MQRVTSESTSRTTRKSAAPEMRFLHAQKGKALEIGSRPIHMRLMV